MDACVAAGGCNGHRPDDQGWGRGNRPVINVSWEDAQAYVQWLSQSTGQHYRLPTSAEWEFAARAGTTTNFSWGDEDPVCDQRARNGANFGNGERNACGDDRTQPVGSFQPNAFGLYDIHGNVSEWVENCDDAPCALRVLRGGSWRAHQWGHRSAYHSWLNPTDRNNSQGFRVARAVGLGVSRWLSPQPAQIDAETTTPAPTPGDESVQPPPTAPSGSALPETARIPGRNFELGRTEVTFTQWDACVAAGGCNGHRPDDQGWGRGDRPVINVSWEDAQAYVQWLSQSTGEHYRLPTSAEWEIGARAGTTTKFSWGDQDPVCDQRALNGANFDACTDDRTQPVGSFQPNAFGLFDVHGNVHEWVEDCEDASCLSRVFRGGSWRGSPFGVSAAISNGGQHAGRSDGVGFRVVRIVTIPFGP